MSRVKNFLWTIAVGGFLGAVCFAWFSPSVISWYFSPPAGAAFSCEPSVNWAIETYRKVIFTGVLLGVITAAILFFAFAKSKKPDENTKNLHSGEKADV